MVAKAEADLAHQAARSGMAQSLADTFPNPTACAMKGHRQCPKHQALVNDAFLEEIKAESSVLANREARHNLPREEWFKKRLLGTPEGRTGIGSKGKRCLASYHTSSSAEHGSMVNGDSEVSKDLRVKRTQGT